MHSWSFWHLSPFVLPGIFFEKSVVTPSLFISSPANPTKLTGLTCSIYLSLSSRFSVPASGSKNCFPSVCVLGAQFIVKFPVLACSIEIKYCVTSVSSSVPKNDAHNLSVYGEISGVSSKRLVSFTYVIFGGVLSTNIFIGSIGDTSPVAPLLHCM